MQFTIVAALLSTSLLANAAPATSSAPIERRACSVAYPRSIGFPINFEIHQDAGGANSVFNFLTFNNVPAGSYGCQFEVNFPTGYPITSSGASAVNIYSTSGESETLFGTVTLQSSHIVPTKFVINSATCSSLMTYKIEIASGTEAGRVAFADTQDAGFTMTYNC
ncbi:Nn.00g095000.m01.CDS01 [Neocucurbitaria sp. VM-36]